jgi:hypothetical protein
VGELGAQALLRLGQHAHLVDVGDYRDAEGQLEVPVLEALGPHFIANMLDMLVAVLVNTLADGAQSV